MKEWTVDTYDLGVYWENYMEGVMVWFHLYTKSRNNNRGVEQIRGSRRGSGRKEDIVIKSLHDCDKG